MRLCSLLFVQETAERLEKRSPTAQLWSANWNCPPQLAQGSRCAARRTVGQGNTHQSRRRFVPRQTGGKDFRGPAECCRQVPNSIRHEDKTMKTLVVEVGRLLGAGIRRALTEAGHKFVLITDGQGHLDAVRDDHPNSSYWI
jgi:succinate dehydrogenase/fumarate reductase flavoprotein subunit